jgi:hypothetical protein
MVQMVVHLHSKFKALSLIHSITRCPSKKLLVIGAKFVFSSKQTLKQGLVYVKDKRTLG